MSPKKWIWLIGIIIILGLGCGIFYLKIAAVPAKSVVLARVDLQAVLEKHPNWDRYRQLQDQIDKLHRKWNNKNSAAKDNENIVNSGSENIAELYKQVNEIEQIYQDESRLKLDNLNNTIKGYVQNRTEQLNAALKERLNSINNQLNKELQNLAKNNEAKAQAYINELQVDYQVKLSNLQLQLSLLDISGDPRKVKTEKNRIQNEIMQIKQEMGQKRAARESQLQKEFQAYAEECKKAAGKEFEQFKSEKETQVREEIAAYRQKLEGEYLVWRTNREQKVESAKKIRQDKLEQEYRQDNARETILKSQREQLKEAIIWDVRQKTKKIASSQNIDCVLTDDYLNIGVRDMTEEVQKTY
jgi:DNA repair exonuclease SbcCD ATPase subunit